MIEFPVLSEVASLVWGMNFLLRWLGGGLASYGDDRRWSIKLDIGTLLPFSCCLGLCNGLRFPSLCLDLASLVSLQQVRVNVSEKSHQLFIQSLLRRLLLLFRFVLVCCLVFYPVSWLSWRGCFLSHLVDFGNLLQILIENHCCDEVFDEHVRLDGPLILLRGRRVDVKDGGS